MKQERRDLSDELNAVERDTQSVIEASKRLAQTAGKVTRTLVDGVALSAKRIALANLVTNVINTRRDIETRTALARSNGTAPDVDDLRRKLADHEPKMCDLLHQLVPNLEYDVKTGTFTRRGRFYELFRRQRVSDPLKYLASHS
jgi:hypothetical protein